LLLPIFTFSVTDETLISEIEYR